VVAAAAAIDETAGELDGPARAGGVIRRGARGRRS